MSLRIVLAAALLLVAALANLLLGAPALASRDVERRWRFGFGPLGVALVALAGVASQLDMLPLPSLRFVAGCGALLSVLGVARDGWTTLGPGRTRKVLIAVVLLTVAPVTVAMIALGTHPVQPDPLRPLGELFRALASGVALAALVAQMVAVRRREGAARRRALRLAVAMGAAELVATLATAAGTWREPMTLPDPVLGVALVVEAAILAELLGGAALPPLLLSRAITASVVGLGLAMGLAIAISHLGYAMPVAPLGLTLGLALLSTALLLVVGDVLSRGVEQALFPVQARLRSELSGVRGEAAALRARLERSERLARAGEMAAAVAHEVKNPLAAVRGYAELLTDLAKPGAAIDVEKLGKAARIIRESSDRIDERVAALLKLGRAAPSPALPSAVPLDALVRDAVMVVEEEARGGIRVALGLQGVAVRAEPDALRGALVNLLRNAVEASPEPSAIEVISLRVGARARVEIADRGPGLDPSLRGRLFEPFQTTKPQGTGLGLPIARAAVEAVGGTLALADRTDGPGARATVELEIDGASAPAEG